MGLGFRLSTGKSCIFPLHTGFVCLMTSLLFQPPSQFLGGSFGAHTMVLSLIFMTFRKPEGLNSDKALSSVSLVICNKSNVHAHIEKDKNIASTSETLQVFRLNCFATSKTLDNLTIVLLQNLPHLLSICSLLHEGSFEPDPDGLAPFVDWHCHEKWKSRVQNVSRAVLRISSVGSAWWTHLFASKLQHLSMLSNVFVSKTIF